MGGDYWVPAYSRSRRFICDKLTSVEVRPAAVLWRVKDAIRCGARYALTHRNLRLNCAEFADPRGRFLGGKTQSARKHTVLGKSFLGEISLHVSN